ncbi:MAG TPA: hypothetical protein VFQ30_14130 [Ktedonobacteraceae bacterium]|nr:hypothetical protein [Ktedonobacteraceae bacterium]
MANDGQAARFGREGIDLIGALPLGNGAHDVACGPGRQRWRSVAGNRAETAARRLPPY